MEKCAGLKLNFRTQNGTYNYIKSLRKHQRQVQVLSSKCPEQGILRTPTKSYCNNAVAFFMTQAISFCCQISTTSLSTQKLISFLWRYNIDIMLRTQIQLPAPLFNQLRQIAEQREWSVAELVRRGMEAYVQTCQISSSTAPWVMPLLRGSGGHLVGTASDLLEADTTVARSTDTDLG